MHSTKLLAVLLLPALLAPALRTGDELSFKPEAASGVTKTYTHKLELKLEEMHFKFGDEEIPASDMGDYEVQVIDESKLVFTDTYVTLGERGPKVLERKFDALASNGVEKVTTEDGDDEHKTERESKLEGKTVVFTRGDDDECEVTFKKDSEGDKALLDGLVEDTDLRAFLPSKAVADGDSWDVDGKLFNAIFGPGGDLHLEDKEDDNEHAVDRAKLRENMQGKGKVTYKGERDENGVKVAVLALEFEIKSSSDTEREIEAGWTQKNDYALELELEGELLWNRKLGHAHALDVHGEVKVNIATTSHSDDDEDGGDVVQTMLLAGSASFAATFEGAQ